MMRRLTRCLALAVLLVLGACGPGRESPKSHSPAAPRSVRPFSSHDDTTTTTDVPSTGVQPLWPQTSLEEVHRAQLLADAGDPRYTWQVDRALGGQVAQHHPDDAEIFGRFLSQELGWGNFLWDEVFAHPDGLDPGDVVYIRCAAGRTDPGYPTDPENPGCAPTISASSGWCCAT